MKKLSGFFIAVFISGTALAQSFSINTDGSTADASSLLDVKSINKGILIPRMSKAQKNAIPAPAAGLLIFQNAPDSVGFYYYNGSNWLWLANTSQQDTAAWKTNGNAGTNINNHFIGTTDNVPLSFRQNNLWLGRLNSSTSNYFIGDSAGIVTTGINNIAIGKNAMQKNTTAFSNVAVGNNALQNNTIGRRNTAIGDSALFEQSFSSNLFTDNTALGNSALRFNNPTANFNGYKNVAIGNDALYANTTGYENTALGVSALRENRSGYANVAIGRSAHRMASTGTFNTYMGYSTGYSDSSGNNNTATGAFASYSNRTGSFNVAAGRSALYSNTTASGNVAVGYQALFENEASEYNVAIGNLSLTNHKRTGFTYNVAVGASALEQDSSGFQNTAIGTSSFRFNKESPYNSGLGINSGYFQKGSDNTFVGAYAGFGQRINPANVILDIGFKNTGLGAGALYRLANGNYNVALGQDALLFDSSGSYNVAVGHNSLPAITSGNNNTGIGYNTNANSGALINTTTIGANAYVTQSNSLILGSIIGINGAAANTNVGIGITAPLARLHVADSSVVFSASGTGTGPSSNPPIQGPGRRLMWYTNKAAFRVGSVSSTQWDNANIGNYSTAMGRNVTASGVSSTAFGFATDAGGDYSTAMGDNTNASGFYSTTMGRFTTAIGDHSTAMGYSTTANSNSTTAMGASTTASGAFSTSMGRFTTASGFISTATGDSTTAGGDFSTAMGEKTISRGYAGTVLGMFNNPIVASGQTSITATTPLFIIGNGDNVSTLSNAMMVRKDGRVGIGTDAPTARLDVDANFKLGGNGTILNEIIKATVTYDIISLAAGGTDLQNFVVANAALNSSVIISPLNALPGGVSIAYARVAIAGIVEVKFVNAGNTTQDPASMNFFITVIR